MTTAARTRATRVTQPSLTQIAAVSARTLAASGCRTTSRTIQASSLTSLTARMMPHGGAVDRGPPAGHRERVRVVELGQLLAGHDPAHTMITSFVHAGENPGAAGGTSSSRPASICGAITPPARRARRSPAAAVESLAACFSSSAAYRFTASASRRPSRTSSSVTSPRPGLVIGDLGRAVVDGQDRRGVVVGAAADPGAAGQPDVGLDLGRAVRAEPDFGGGGHAVTSRPPGSGTRSARSGSVASSASASAVSVYGTGTSGSGGRPRYRRSTATA